MSAPTMESIDLPRTAAQADPEAATAQLDDSLNALFHTALTFSPADLGDDESDELVVLVPATDKPAAAAAIVVVHCAAEPTASATAVTAAKPAIQFPACLPALFNRTKGAALCAGASITPRIGRAPGPVATCKLSFACDTSASGGDLPAAAAAATEKADQSGASAIADADDDGNDYARFAARSSPGSAAAAASSGWTPIAAPLAAPNQSSQSRVRSSVRSRGGGGGPRPKRIVCSTPLGSVRFPAAAVAAAPRSPPTPGTPPQQRPMTRAEFREYAKHSLSVAADRDIRYLDTVIIPRIRREANRLVRLGEELAKQDPSTMTSARRRQYRAQYRMVHGSTAEDLAETEREYQQMYGHRLPKGVKPRFGLRV